MAAHSARDFGGGRAEKLALAEYRQVLWQGRVLNSQFTDEQLRNQGRCPPTPEEIGLLLAALGLNNCTRLYLASHKVYGGEARISTLGKLFASAEERAKVEGKVSLLAAVDYYVSMQSDILFSASPGNMHNALVGHRAYNNLKTVRLNMVLLGKLFLNKSTECRVNIGCLSVLSVLSHQMTVNACFAQNGTAIQMNFGNVLETAEVSIYYHFCCYLFLFCRYLFLFCQPNQAVGNHKYEEAQRLSSQLESFVMINAK
ncbi:hypothetical protein ACH5RR_034709 [Cinchona calisaya]|uniref:O-fucosyltransferase family protein n=1 Tax=Cinchona calisaya TaxID=153742 RepID=A0ABD2YBP6_9GENT